MMAFILGLLLTGLTFIAISLQKTYFHIPERELKRRARAGDEMAALLYRAVGYGASLQVLLWLVVGVSAGALFVVWARQTPTLLALIGCGAVVLVGFAWMPNTRVTAAGITLARWATPFIAWLLNHLSPLLNYIYGFVLRHRNIHIHTGLYQKDDLVDLIDRQQVQADNRMNEMELSIVRHALLFGDKLVRDIMVPRRAVKMVSATDHVGPILLGELHDSGYSRFPVYQANQDSIVGTLYLRSLVRSKASGQVASLMSKDVYYVHDEQPLIEALQAFIKTKHHLFIVVNAFEEVVGIVTIEDILEQIIGKLIVDEFDTYDDMRAVATRHAAKDHDDRSHADHS